MKVTVAEWDGLFAEISLLLLDAARRSCASLSFLWLLVITMVCVPAVSQAQVLGDPVDVSQDFQKLENVYFIGARVIRLSMLWLN